MALRATARADRRPQREKSEASLRRARSFGVSESQSNQLRKSAPLARDRRDRNRSLTVGGSHRPDRQGVAMRPHSP
jgi:hypothetical protein